MDRWREEMKGAYRGQGAAMQAVRRKEWQHGSTEAASVQGHPLRAGPGLSRLHTDHRSGTSAPFSLLCRRGR